MNENNAAKTKATKNLNHIPYIYSGANERAKMIDLLLLKNISFSYSPIQGKIIFQSWFRTLTSSIDDSWLQLNQQSRARLLLGNSV